MNNHTVVNMHHSQDEIREEVSKILTKTFLSKNIFSLPPSSILTIFFRFLPQTGIRFMNRFRQTCSQAQIKILEAEINKKLLPVYAKFNQHPLPREIVTDIFAELAKHHIQVIAHRNTVMNNTF